MSEVRHSDGSFTSIMQARITATRGKFEPTMSASADMLGFLCDRVFQWSPVTTWEKIEEMEQVKAKVMAGEQPLYFMGKQIQIDGSLPSNEIRFVNDRYPERNVLLVIEP